MPLDKIRQVYIGWMLQVNFRVRGVNDKRPWRSPPNYDDGNEKEKTLHSQKNAKIVLARQILIYSTGVPEEYSSFFASLQSDFYLEYVVSGVHNTQKICYHVLIIMYVLYVHLGF